MIFLLYSNMSTDSLHSQRVYDDDDNEDEEEAARKEAEAKSAAAPVDPLVSFREAFQFGVEALRLFKSEETGQSELEVRYTLSQYSIFALQLKYIL